MKSNLLVLFFWSFAHITSLVGVVAYSQFNLTDWYCIKNVGTYTSNSTYQKNLGDLLPNLADQASSSNFGNSSIGEGIDKVYTIYNCRGDLSSTQCHDCVKESSQAILEKCPVEKESIIWYEECMVRYSNRAIFSLEEESPYSWHYNSSSGSDSISSPQLATGKVEPNIDGLIKQAAYNKTSRGYAIGQTSIAQGDNMYFLVQCTPDILGSQCEKCLRAALRSIEECCGMDKSSMKMFFPSCHLRYDRHSVVLNIGDSKPIVLNTGDSKSTSAQSNSGGRTSTLKRLYRDLIIVSLLTLFTYYFV